MKSSDLEYLYHWASNADFPLRRAPTAVGYSNKDIYFCWLKAIYRNGAFGGVRKTVVKDLRAQEILNQHEVVFSTVACFEPGTELGPHKDPPVYGIHYRRIQIPLYIPSNDCYMIWRGEKVFWEEGVPQIYDVMDEVHEGYNYSDDDMLFLFVDIRKDNVNSTLHEV